MCNSHDDITRPVRKIGTAPRPARIRPTKLIGWREIVAFPEWGIDGIEAKIDTGARTSAIHVEDVVRLKGDRVRFHLVTSHKKPFKHVTVTADLVRTTRVRSSTGHTQTRYVVAGAIRIGTHRRVIEMSLVGRDKMLCRMLLGRTALAGYLIDPQAKYVHGSAKRRRVKRESPK